MFLSQPTHNDKEMERREGVRGRDGVDGDEEMSARASGAGTRNVNVFLREHGGKNR